METKQELHTENIASSTPQQETIFNDMLDTKPYEKNLRTARIWLYVVAALQTGIGIYEYASAEDEQVGLIAGLIDGGIAVTFLLLAIWSYKKPAIAFMTALILYIAIHIGMMIIDPTNIYKGILIKILVVVALVKAFNDAREFQKLKDSITGSAS